MPKSAAKKRPRLRPQDLSFLKKLGERCRRLREAKGYSIDRLSKAAEQLSPSVIHRLEEGSGPVSVVSLLRFAEVMGPPVHELLTPWSSKFPLLSLDDARAKSEAFKTLLPVYSLKAAAGYFGRGEDVEPEGWVDATQCGRLDSRMFVAHAVGHSMEPRIHDGDYLVFRANPVGSRQGKIVLAQYRGPADPDTGGSYTVKKYATRSTRDEVTLVPLNKKYDPIVLRAENAEDVQIVAELVDVLFS